MRHSLHLAAFLVAALPASAAVVVHTTVGSFNTATAGMTQLTSENWSSGTGAAASIFQLNDPLTFNVANGNFATGAALGLTVQSNTLGNNPTSTSPRGTNGLSFGTTGYVGTSGNAQVSNQLSTNNVGDSLDILLDALIAGFAPTAVRLSPLYYQETLADPSAGPVTIRVYGAANNLLATTTVSGITDVSELAFIGFTATGGDTIRRINLFTAGNYAGADNIVVLGGTGVPEPATVSMAALSLAGLCWLRRRRA